MKKLTLTFCALFVVFAVAPALFADGPERSSGKEKEVLQPAPPVCDFYRAHEWDLDLWGSFDFSANSGSFDVPRDDPFFPDGDADGDDLAIDNPNVRINIGQVSKDQLMARDNTWGGGADIKYFWSRYFGAGIEGLGLAAKTNFAGGGLGTITFRYPFGRFAPYAFGGLGFIDGGATLYRFFNEKHVFIGGVVVNESEFYTDDPVGNHHIRGLGQLGGGLEFRLTCHIGLMADFAWNFVFGKEESADRFLIVQENGASPITSTALTLKPGTGSDNQNFGMVRFGVTFSY